MKGQCNCGNVSFGINELVHDIYYCHCSICRRSTGANGIPVLVVKNTQFKWTSGDEFRVLWRKPNHDWQKCFCKLCGSPLPDKNDDSTMYIPAGLIIENSEDLQVAHHIWVESKAAWDVIGDQGVRHSTEFNSKL